MIGVSVVHWLMARAWLDLRAGARVPPATRSTAIATCTSSTPAPCPHYTGRVTVPVLVGPGAAHDRQQRVVRDHPDAELGVRRRSAPRPATTTRQPCGPRSTESTSGSTPRSTTASTAPASPPRRRPTTRRSPSCSRRSTGSRSGWPASAISLGDRVTEADWRLFTTLLRFDPVYHGHFKCNLRRLVDYPQSVGLHARALPVAGRRRDRRLRAHQGPLLRQPWHHQPDRHRAHGARSRLRGAPRPRGAAGGRLGSPAPASCSPPASPRATGPALSSLPARG